MGRNSTHDFQKAKEKNEAGEKLELNTPSPKIAIIPVYNENGKIGKVLSKFTKDLVDQICLVLDCPNKSILEEIRAAVEKNRVQLHLITNTSRKGIGYSIREGITYALKNEFEVIVIMAGNSKDNPREISRLLSPITKEGFDYVQGSRFLPGAVCKKNPMFRRIFSRLYPFIWSLLTKVKCSDVTNGFRAYATRIFRDKRIDIWQGWLDRYGLEYYIHYKVLALGYKIREVAVSKTYPHRHKGGYSKIRPLQDWWDIVRPLIYLRLGIKR